MKKIIPLLIVLAVICCSCSKTDNPLSENQAQSIENSENSVETDILNEEIEDNKNDYTDTDPVSDVDNVEGIGTNCELVKCGKFNNDLAWVKYADGISGNIYTGCIDKSGHIQLYTEETYDLPSAFSESEKSFVNKNNKTYMIDRNGEVEIAYDTDGTCLLQDDYTLYVRQESGFDSNKRVFQIFDPEGNLVQELEEDPSNMVMFYNYHGNGVFSFLYENAQISSGDFYFAKSNKWERNLLFKENLALQLKYNGCLIFYIGDHNDKVVFSITDDIGNWKNIEIPEDFGHNPVLQDCSDRYVLFANGTDFYYIYDIIDDAFKYVEGEFTDRLYWPSEQFASLQKASCSDSILALPLSGQDGNTYIGLYNPDTMELLCDPILGDSATVENEFVFITSSLIRKNDVYDKDGRLLRSLPSDIIVDYSDGVYIVNSSSECNYFDEQFNELFPDGVILSDGKYFELQ